MPRGYPGTRITHEERLRRRRAKRRALWLFPDDESHTKWHVVESAGIELPYEMPAVRLAWAA